MGYTTDFFGSLEFNKPVTPWLAEYINKFSGTRRMKRDPEKIKELFPDYGKMCFNGDLGKEGEYFIGGVGPFGQDEDESVINGNMPAKAQPGLWCQWIITEGGTLEWDGGEKFYNYEEWLEYLIDNFFEPLGYILNGDIEWQGEDYDDFGTIHVENNIIYMKEGIRSSALQKMDTDTLIEELEKRGYKVTA
jgi:hypothetical protein